MNAIGSIPVRRPGTRFPTASPARLRARRWLRPLGGAALTAAVVAATWWLLAPPALGGSTSFVSVDGTSMVPCLHRDDLVTLRPARTYRVGDVVAYRSTLIGRVVLHRIVAVHGGRFTFKGDNNSFLDPDHPTRSELVGRLWFQVPRGGQLVRALHVPWVVGTFAALLVVAVGLGGVFARGGDEAALRT